MYSSKCLQLNNNTINNLVKYIKLRSHVNTFTSNSVKLLPVYFQKSSLQPPADHERKCTNCGLVTNTASQYLCLIGSNGLSVDSNRTLLHTAAIRLITTNMNFHKEEKAKHTPPNNLGTKVQPDEVKRFMVDCMVCAGAVPKHAEDLASVLIAGDERGHFSHGLNRLEMYVNDVSRNICNGTANPSIEKESVSTALVNGNNALGPVVGNFCMDLAIKKAKETGIGWVCARGSNHYGIAGWYSLRAANQGLLGMSMTNTSPLVAPTRSKKGALGTNPIALSAPGKNTDDFTIDMATCTVALGKIEVQRRKEEPIPEGWAIDSEGQVCTDPTKVMQEGGALMPLGGTELNSGYKGYGLAMMVEVLCGILSGGSYGPHIRSWMTTDREANLGQCFMAIDPSYFAPGFTDRMSDLMNYCRDMEPVDPNKPVLVAGDPERQHVKKIEAEGVITYHINQIKDSWQLAQVLGVTPMKSS